MIEKKGCCSSWSFDIDVHELKQSKYEGRQDNKRATKRRINGPDLEPGKREECRNRDPFSKNRGLLLDHALV